MASVKSPTHLEPAWLGIDCGATRSVAAYVCGEIRRRAAAGAGNLRLLSDTQLEALFTELRSVHAGLPEPAGLAIGMASARLESDRARMRRFAAKVWPGTRCHACDDLQTALAAADLEARSHHAAPYSALVITLAGTGSCFFGRNSRGRSVKVGGWGHIIGDEGSAYEIGLSALKTMVWDYDRAGELPPLGRRVLRFLMLNKPEEMSAWVVNATKSDVAGLAVEVSAAAAAGDRIARRILGDAAKVIAAQAVTCAGRLTSLKEPVRFVLTGSVLTKNAYVAKRVAALIRECRPRATVVPLNIESAWGAVELAKQHTGRDAAALPSVKSASRHGRTARPALTGLIASLDANLAMSPTEQRNPRSMNLDRLGIDKAVELMLGEDERIPGAIRKERAKIQRAIAWIVRAFKSGGRLFYVGAGTSGRLGVLDASECPPTFRSEPDLVQGIIAGGQSALWRAVEGAEDDPAEGARATESRGISRSDVVVGIAASGRTPFVWGALDRARRAGARTVLITFNPHLRIPPALKPSLVIAPDVGPEILTGSTRLKSGTATKLILNMLTTLAMVRSGKVLSNLMVDVKASNVKLRDRAVRIVRTLTGADETAALQALERNQWDIKKAVAALNR